MVTWVLFLGIGLIIGVVAGVYFARLDDVSNKQKKALQQKLDTAEQQLKTYQSQVTEHFLKTASLVNSMTESYKAVHEHLAVGATELCDREVTVARLETPATKQLDTIPQKNVSQDNVQQNVQQTEQSKQQQQGAQSAQAKSPEAEDSQSTAKAGTNPEVSEQKQTEKAEPQEVQSAASEEPQTEKESASAQQGEAPKSAEATQPPSTPESLHVDESSSDKARKEPEQTAPASVSRMVH